MVKHLKKIRRRNYVILGLFAIIYLCTTMCAPAAHTGKAAAIPDTDGKIFAGSASCISCHKSIYESHIGTAHYKTSKPASKEFIKGSFETGKNHFIYNKWMEVVMENKNGGYYQTAFMNGEQSQSERFDIVIGSGRKGQTYLYWNNGKLYQLPVSYYTPLDDWCNSPGYSTNYIRFSRQIPAHCIECHGTHAKAEVRPDEGTVFTKSQLVYGVDCEKCHGPGTEHIVFHTAHPGEKTGKFIIDAKLLARQQRLDACALCHSGVRDELKPAFSFKVGDKLDDFSKPAYNTDSMSTLDVHGNQYGLLTSSKCFRVSQMDCSSCHNVHVNEVNSPKLFSQRCMTCHTQAAHNTCTMPATSGLVLGDNCIDCHMPSLPSQKISLEFSNASKSTPDLVRTHRIAIYPGSVKAYLEKLRSKGAGM
ncbi:MAG TPA: cytochrome c3 family protein [Puia sp.]|nr:cytochrome c3 family protein [Puia sp.]